MLDFLTPEYYYWWIVSKKVIKGQKKRNSGTEETEGLKEWKTGTTREGKNGETKWQTLKSSLLLYCL